MVMADSNKSQQWTSGAWLIKCELKTKLPELHWEMHLLIWQVYEIFICWLNMNLQYSQQPVSSAQRLEDIK